MPVKLLGVFLRSFGEFRDFRVSRGSRGFRVYIGV